MGAKYSTVGPTKQLSELQMYILAWLEGKESVIYEREDKKAIQELNNKGVPWRIAELYSGKPPKNASVNISKSLKRLQNRGLVVLYDSSEGIGKKPRTSHIKLTAQGRTFATLIALQTGGLLPNLTFDETQRVLGKDLDDPEGGYDIADLFRSRKFPKRLPVIRFGL